MNFTSPEPSAHAVASGFSSRKRQWALGVVALAFVMDILDTTIVNIAIPSIQGSLHTSQSTVEWLVGGYALAFSALLITGGRMGDTYGYRTVFLSGVSLFAIASLLCGIAWNPHFLVVARVFQGMAAAMMAPQVLALMQIMYPPHERIKVQAFFGLMGGSSAALGPVLGALLIRSNLFGLGWRPIFLINIPVALVALWAGKALLPSGRSTHPLAPDIRGAFFVMTILVLFMFPLFEGTSLGWPWYLYVSMSLAILLVPVFIRYTYWQIKRGRAPLIAPDLFRDRAFSVGLLVSFFVSMGVSGYLLFFTLYVQVGLEFSVLKAGCYGLPFAVGVLLSLSLLGRRLVPLLGRKMIPLGAMMMAISMTVMAINLPAKAPGNGLLLYLVIPQLVSGLGLGIYLAAMSPIILSNVDVRHAGIAAGVVNSTQQLCGAVGIAVVGGCFFMLLAHGAEGNLRAISGSSASVAPRLRACVYQELRLVSGRGETEESCRLTAAETPANSAESLKVLRDAELIRIGTFRWAFRGTMILELVLLLSAAGVSLKLPNHLRVFTTGGGVPKDVAA